MPIPKPKKGETEKKFFSRCMGDSVMTKEFSDKKIRGGVCGSAWSKKNNLHLNISQTILTNFSSRIQYKGEDEFLVVPITALVEGVHYGSGGAVFYPADEISQTAEKWNGVPLTIGHPKREGKLVGVNTAKEYIVGTFENVRWEDGKLKGEGWIDMKSLINVSPRTLELLNMNKNMEVSTGLFTSDDGIEGTWRGEEFDSTVFDFEPDHLALLPHNEGACNFAAGCGVRNNSECKQRINRINKEGGGVKSEVSKERKKIIENALSNKIEVILSTLRQNGYYINELSHSKINEKLRKMINDMDKPGVMNFLREVFDNRFIFEKTSEGDSKLFELSYSVNKEDEIKIKGDPKEVQHKEEFVPVNNILTLEQEGIMANDAKKVQALIDNQDLSFTEKDKERLENLDEITFNNLVEVGNKFDECRCNKEEEEKLKANKKKEESKKKEEEAEVKEPVVNKEEKKEATFEEILATASAEDREAVTYGKEIYLNQKAALVKEITANERSSFTKEELEKKNLKELQALAKFGNLPSFAGNSVRNGEEEIKANERHADGTGVPDMPVMSWGKK